MKVNCGSEFGGKVFGVKCEKETGHSGLHSGGGTAWVTKKVAAVGGDKPA